MPTTVVLWDASSLDNAILADVADCRPHLPGSAVVDLDKFVKAQDPVIETVLRELRSGRKQTHWMWFVFPQIRGLGHSPMAQHYAIADLAEARAYLAHAVLGPRLRECVDAVLDIRRRSLEDIFGWPDDMKFRSSMTLFAVASGNDSLFSDALERYCGGQMDVATLDLLKQL